MKQIGPLLGLKVVARFFFYTTSRFQDFTHLHTRSVIFLKQVLELLRRCMTYFVFKGSVVALNSIPANEAEENKRFLASPPSLTGLLWLTVAVTNYSLLAVTRMYKAMKS